MTAAAGILHKEYHEKEYSKRGGPFQMVQLWVNLPAKYKMTTPKYQAIGAGDIGKYPLADGGRVEVIAGSFEGVKGPASTFSPIELYNIHLKKGTSLSIDLPENFNTGILVIEGNATINSIENAPADHFVLFENGGTEILCAADEDTVLLVLSGQPIDEPLAAYGPFLMNTYQELEEAYDDFRKGKFGVLEDD
jgi:redox-sensitive bicupin YhaK (pirin superfamily)